MSVRQSASRWFVVTVAAYAMVLHALVMGVASAPRAEAGGSLIGTLQQLCSGGYRVTPDGDPQTPAARVMPCAFCGLGHAAADVPLPVCVAPPVNIIETVALEGAPASVRPRLDFLAEARPRAPPAFV